jgi:DNA-binding XRE family transcriptional regulator
MPGDMDQVVRNRLRELRRGQRLPLWGLAVRAGTTPTTLSAIERWGYKPGADLCARIAAALKVSTHDIWTEDEVQS